MSQSVTFSYDAVEDRIAAITDINSSSSPSFWLTRRMTLAFLRQASEHLERTSSAVAHAAADHRADVAAFEREAALAATAGALSPSGVQALAQGKVRAVRANSMGFQPHGVGVRFILQADGLAAASDWSRPLFLRILKVLEGEAAKAGWLDAASRSKAQAAPVSMVRH